MPLSISIITRPSGMAELQSFRRPVVMSLVIFAQIYEFLNRFFMNEPGDVMKGLAAGWL